MILCLLPRKGGSTYGTEEQVKKQSGSESGFPEAELLSRYQERGAEADIPKRQARVYRLGNQAVRR